MSFQPLILTTPLPAGKTIPVFRTQAEEAGAWEVKFTLDADTLLVSLYVTSVTGTLDISVITQSDEGEEVEIIAFPSIVGPTTDLLIRKAAVALSVIKVRISATGGGAHFDVRARGIQTGDSSAKILGASNLRVSTTMVTTTPSLLIPISLEDRNGVVFKNYLGGGTLFWAETAAKANPTDGYPIGPRESIAFDIQAGQTIYGAADAGIIDVRIAEAGG